MRLSSIATSTGLRVCRVATRWCEGGVSSADETTTASARRRDPTVSTQPAPVGRAAACDLGINPSGSKLIAMRLGVVGPVGVESIGAASRAPRLASDRRDRVHQRFQLANVRGVGAGQGRRQRDASAVGDHMVFTPGFRAIRRVRTGLLAPAQGAHRRTVDDRTRPVDAVGAVQFSQQKLVQRLPDTGLVPVARSRRQQPGHTAATAPATPEGRSSQVPHAGLEWTNRMPDQRLARLSIGFSSGIAENRRGLGRRQQGELEYDSRVHSVVKVWPS